MTYPEMISKLELGENFSFSRFGDGEFNCMQGKNGANCDGHKYYPDLGVELLKAWNKPKGVVALQRLAREQFKIEGDYPDADILHRASINGEIDKFTDVLINRNVILVGPKHLRELKIYNSFREVPLKNAWEVYRHILDTLSYVIQPNDVVLYCCGMMAEVIIHELYLESFTQIDCGSVFDPYVGVNSRGYHKKLKL